MDRGRTKENYLPTFGKASQVAYGAAWPATLVALTEELETKDLIPFIDEIFEITYDVAR